MTIAQLVLDYVNALKWPVTVFVCVYVATRYEN